VNALLEANLRALSTRDPALAGAVRAAAPDPGLSFTTSESGLTVPVRRDGPALHSRVDPVREARRLAAALPPAGVAVFLGLGGGYAPAALLSAGSLFAGVIVERGAPVLRALLEHCDLSGLLADPRIAVVAEPAAVTGAVLEAWAPALMGDLRTVPLRPWCDASREFFDRAAASVEAARDLASADWAAQARFGRRWFTNALLNLPAVERAGLAIAPVGSAIVTGAGPSLDRCAGRLPAARRAGLLAATDTSLPALLARGIVPDLAVSIDCQLYGYHHVMAGLPPGLPLLLDLSSPPVLARSHRNVGFFASAHPLARWVSRHWRSLPDVDTSGGNVAHAAVSTVHALGAREVRLAGVDFSYPLGSPYARGTWLHPYFRSREDRCSPSEGRFFGMLVAAPGSVREAAPEGPRYTSPLMRGYRRSFERFAGSLDAVILDDWCLGPDLQVRRGTGPSPARWDGGFSMGSPRSGWRRMLGSYAALVAELPAPGRPPASWWHGLEPGHREAWQTILPLLPGFAGDPVEDRGALLERARRWALSRVSLFLAVDDGSVPHE
jgi:6-hydroxymethylpterin diphosphokinase MptE-like